MAINRISNKPRLGDVIGVVEGKPVKFNKHFQNFLNSLEQELNNNVLGDGVQLRAYTVAQAQALTAPQGLMIYVTDETGGEIMAVGDGTNFRRSSDRAVIS